MDIWKIASVMRDPTDTNHLATDPNAIYKYGLTKPSSCMVVQSDFHFSDVKLLKIHFDVHHTKNLTGKTFTSEREFELDVMDLLLTQIRHGGVYTPPSTKTVRDRIVCSLANMECPDFSDLDRKTVLQAIEEVWDNRSVNEKWLARLATKVDLLGGVILRKADRTSFPKLSLNQPSTYLELIKNEKIQKCILTLGNPPVIFVD